MAILKDKQQKALQGMGQPAPTQNAAANTSVGMAMNAQNQANSLATVGTGLPTQ